jgi:ubiquitin carboxyl-terminal hydrolase 7
LTPSESGSGSGILRLLEIQSHKIFSVFRPETKIQNFAETFTKSYRLEEVPADQVHLDENEMLVPVGHYQVT